MINIRSVLKFLFMPSLAVILSLTLSSCDVELDADMQQTITLYCNGAWEAEMTITLDKGLVEFIAEAEEYSLEPDGGLVSDYISEVDEFDVQVSWDSHTNDAGDVTYDVHMRGKGLETLKYSVFNDATLLEEVDIDGNKRFVLSHAVSFPEAALRSYTITLIGGRIISSNGQLVDDSTVRWFNPSGRIEATFTGKSRFGFLQAYVILAGIGGFMVMVLLVIAGIVYYFKFRQPNTSESNPS
jgi:hypothetical protein